MSPRLLTLVLATASIALLAVACDDSESPPPGNPTQKSRQALTQKDHVLNNIEYAYVKKNIETYDELLNTEFTFFYNDGDVGGGGGPVQWGRDVEGTATRGIFDAASSIDMDLKWEDGVTWTPLTPESAPTETWYTTTVDYNFSIKIETNTYVPDLGAKATFTVRNAGTEDAPHWQLVEFRDLGGPNSLLALHQATSTEASTWGQVKALYR